MMEVAKWLIIVHAAGTLLVAVIVLIAAFYFAARWLAHRSDPLSTNKPARGNTQKAASAANRGAPLDPDQTGSAAVVEHGVDHYQVKSP